jgi:Domain of unknown function (DUF1929)
MTRVEELRVETFTVRWDMFCNGMVVLQDGRPFVFGGTIAYDQEGPPRVQFKGDWRASVYEAGPPRRFVDVARLRHGRWYPTGTVLADGSVMVIAGFNEDGVMNRQVEIYKPSGNTWVQGGPTFPGLQLYPRQHLLPDGRVFVSGSQVQSQIYDPVARTFTAGPSTTYGKLRNYGASVLLPLTPANNFRPKVMLFGGGQGGTNTTATTDLIDLGAPQSAWRWTRGPNMSVARQQLNATLLPTGHVLISGGSPTNEVGSVEGRTTQLYDPVTNTFRAGAPMRFSRLYHSNALLLADGTVMAVGSNPSRGYEAHIEIYSPPYIFNSTGGAAVRPLITAAAENATYNGTFTVQSPVATSIRSVVLVRPGAVTHSLDMEQRLVGMTFTVAGTTLTVRAPLNSKLAPPGYYMLFIIDNAGVPSVARFVQLR